MTEKEFIKKTGAPINKVKDFRRESMLEGVDFIRAGKTGREVHYTLDGEAKIQAWFDESQEGLSEKDFDEQEENEWTAIVRRVVGIRSMHVDAWDGRLLPCFVPRNFRANVGERIPIRSVSEDCKLVTLDIDRVQKEPRFKRVLKQLKQSRKR